MAAGEGQQPPVDSSGCHELLTSSLNQHQSSDISESGRCQLSPAPGVVIVRRG